MFKKSIEKVTICCLLVLHMQVSGRRGRDFQDQTSPRANTLFDDADDIQRQLDNEARDRLKFGRPKTIWVFHFPTHFPEVSPMVSPEQGLIRPPRQTNQRVKMEEESKGTPPTTPEVKDLWDYGGQQGWAEIYPDCGGRSQSPVDLPTGGLVKARGARPMLFKNFDIVPKSMTLINDRRRLILVGDWQEDQRPVVYGGAAHSRRYLFHSLILHWPSEHSVAGLKYPLETQGLFVSAEYKDMSEALVASPADPQAFLAIVNLYKYGNHTHKGLEEILDVVKSMGLRNGTLVPKSLSHFNPPFKEYACYQGSMTWPPCTESVLWLIRGRTLSIMRDTVETRELLMTSDNRPKPYLFRFPQPMNDRKVYLFR